MLASMAHPPMAQLPLGLGARKRDDDDRPARTVLSVGQVQNQLRRTVEGRFRHVAVQGEISNLRVPGSGHAYFTLKDRHAALKAMMFRDDLRQVAFRPKNGQEVVAAGQVSIYEKSGDLQLVVRTLEIAGVGALYEKFERNKAELIERGLTAPENKRPIPRYPRRIGVVTSHHGAALRDVLRTIDRRDPRAHVILVDTKVQGRSVEFEIRTAIKRLDASGLVDVIILCRGGGSLEDLWAFNELPVAHAIVEAQTPIVTGIGHETDTTIADLVADAVASTPTAAAERCVPIRADVIARIERQESRLQRNLHARLTAASRDLFRLQDRLRDPTATIRARAQQIDDLTLRAERAVDAKLKAEADGLRTLEHRLREHAPAASVARTRERLDAATARLEPLIRRRIEAARTQLEAGRGHLDPLVRRRIHDERQHLDRLARSLTPAAERHVRTQRGRLDATVADLGPASERALAARGERLTRVLGRLEALSPLKVLGRGYAVVRDEEGHVVASKDAVAPGDRVTVRVADGRFAARVEDDQER